MASKGNLDLKLLFARSNIPELEPFYLPDNWRADQRVPQEEHCQTCHWDGYWDDILKAYPSQQSRSCRDRIKAVNLEQSASAGNFCCAVLLALSRKLSPLVGDCSEVRFSEDTFGTLSIGRKPSWVRAVYVTGNSDETRVPPGVELNPFKVPNPQSDESLAWAQSHIQDCLLSHSCHAFKSHDQRLPTRLVHIPQDFEACGVRLIADAPANLPEGSRYAALTYCWGGEKPQCLTTGENFDLHSTRGIPWASMPRLFRDAMQYSRRLGLEYIWIDSLCIIQQNTRDWDQESPRMFSYYSNAYLTLGSTFSLDCHDSLFGQRQTWKWRLYLFDMIFKDVNLPVYACRFPDFPRNLMSEETRLRGLESHFTTNFPGSPYNLFKRAWTYQERLVSPRLLLFTHKQVVFECYAGRFLQEVHPDAPNKKHLKGVYGQLLESHGSEYSWATWREIVSSFSTLQLSFPTDKLPAFAAIAQQYLSHLVLPHAAEDEYLCGLRKGHLHCDLLWTTLNDRSLARKLNKKLFCEGDSYLAPSWSWASNPRETSYWHLVNKGQYLGRATITLLSDEGLQFTEAGRFGRTQRGSYIVVRGPVIDCTLFQWQVGSNLDLFKGQRLRLSNGWEHSLFKFTPDYSHGHKGFYVDEVPLCLLQTWVHKDFLGLLVLHKNSETGRHYRVGVCQLLPSIHGHEVMSYLEKQFQIASQRVLEIE